MAALDEKRCVACGACANVCPQGAISVLYGCFARAESEICLGCGLCARTCPVGCITAVEREAVA